MTAVQHELSNDADWVTAMDVWTPYGDPFHDHDRSGNLVGVVLYHFADLWEARIERHLDAPTEGVSSLNVRALPPDDDDLGAWDGDGLQVVQLRGIPLNDARKRLDDLWLQHVGADVIYALPSRFADDHAYAELARAVVLLEGRGALAPVSLIARYAQPRASLNTWNARVSRARTRGFIVNVGTDAALSGRALSLLG